MAKKRNVFNLIRSLTGTAPVSEEKPEVDLTKDSATAFSKSEQQQLLKRLDSASKNQDISKDAVLRYVSDLSKTISDSRKDNIEILKLAPEINQAASIVVPSILSPNTLSGGDIQFTCDAPNLEAEEKLRVSAIVIEYFNKHVKLDSKLAEWIRESFYVSGAKPLLVIPMSEIDNLMNNKTFMVSATESFNTTSGLFDEQCAETLFGFTDTISGKTVINPIDYVGALESLADTYGDATVNNKPYHNPNEFLNNKDGRSADFLKLVKSITGTEALSVSDNPDILKKSKLQKSAVSNISQKLDKRYIPTELISIEPKDDITKGQPLFMELPTESVMPIYTPGIPSDHVGYLIAIDSAGNPMAFNDVDDEIRPKVSASTEQRSTFDNLFKAFGFNDIRASGDKRTAMMASLYGQIVDKHLKKKLEAIGLMNVDIAGSNNVYKAMFSRYLSKRKTKILFVPKDLVTYCCYQYNQNGTGRSKLEDIKFVLSLRITILVCRMLSAMNNAVDRRTISATFSDEMGNPFEFVETVKREAISKALMSFSFDPDEITQSLAQRSLSVKVKGYPGAPEFDVTNEANQRTSNDFDEALNEDIKNLMIVGLDVPPSAMNSLSENEYAKSVATVNLLFSRKVTHWQGITEKFVTDFVQKYLRFSKPLHEEIAKAVAELNEDKTEAGTRTEKDIHEIIRHIKMILPPPNIAADTTQFEELDKMIASTDTVLKAIFDQDLFANDHELADTLSVVRATIKSDVVVKYIDSIGLGSSIKIPEVSEFDGSGLLLAHQTMLNIKQALSQQKKAFTGTTPSEEESDI